MEFGDDFGCRLVSPERLDVLIMAVEKVQPGQVWLLEGTEEGWLVTKIYSEAFTSYAMLRKAGGGDSDVRRLKIVKSADGVALPGFKFSQESGQF